MPKRYFHIVAAAGLLVFPAGVSSAQTNTNEGSFGDEETIRELNDRIQVLEQRQAERIERELESLRGQLREARRLERARLPLTQAEKVEIRATKKTRERADNDRWRYRYHQGRWWYWRPSNSWAVYVQGRWVAYQAPGAARYYR